MKMSPMSIRGCLKHTALPPPVPDPNNDFGIALKGLKTGLKDILIGGLLFLTLIDDNDDDDKLIVLIRGDVCLYCLSLML